MYEKKLQIDDADKMASCCSMYIACVWLSESFVMWVKI